MKTVSAHTGQSSWFLLTSPLKCAPSNPCHILYHSGGPPTLRNCFWKAVKRWSWKIPLAWTELCSCCFANPILLLIQNCTQCLSNRWFKNTLFWWCRYTITWKLRGTCKGAHPCPLLTLFHVFIMSEKEMCRCEHSFFGQCNGLYPTNSQHNADDARICGNCTDKSYLN